MRSEKTETINGHECKVYTANNVELVTRTRIEHMSADDRKAYESNNQGSRRNILGGVMNFLESSATSRSTTTEASNASSAKASNVC